MSSLPTNPSESFKRLNPQLYPRCMASDKMPEGTALLVSQDGQGKVIDTLLVTNLVPSTTTDEAKLNKLERAWLRELRVLYPEERIQIQKQTLKLADRTRYTPDFSVIDANGQLVFYETKGFFREDARVKIMVAARQFRFFRFILVQRKKGQWLETPIKP